MNDHAATMSARVGDADGGLALPDHLRRQLDAFRRTLWWIKSLEAVGLAIVGTLVAWLVLFVADRLTDTPAVVRWALFGLAVACGAAVPWAMHRWIWRHRGLDRLARLISRRFPSLGDQLLGAVEIVRSRNEQQRSRSLCEAAIRQVAEAAGRHDLGQAVPQPRHLLWTRLAAVSLVVAGSLPWFFPAAAANAWARLLSPWRHVDRFTFTRVDRLPDPLVVPYGEETEIRVGLREDSQWRPARALARIGGGLPLAAEQANKQYTFLLPPQAANAALRLAIGDARQRVAVMPTLRPEIKAIEASVRLPAYLERPEPITKDARGGGVAVVRGSVAAVAATATRDLAEALVDGAQVAADAATISTPAILVDRTRDLSMEWRDTLGLSGRKPLVVRLAALDDEPPTIVADGLAGRTVLLETDTVRFRLAARDDFGVKQMGIEWQIAGDEPEENTASTRNTASAGENLLAVGGPRAETLEAVGTFSPREAGIASQTVEVRGFAEDYLPDRGRAYTAPAVFLVMTANDHALWMSDQIARWKQQTAEVRDRELSLLARNEELQGLSDEELDAPENRKAIREQAAAERANASRLARLADSGGDLVRQAARNPEFDAATLEGLAEQVEELQAMAETRMPDIGELLQAAAQAGKPQDAAPGESKAGESKAGESASPPSPPSPQAGDKEDSLDRADEQPDDAKEGDGAGPSAGQLGLPSTSVGNVPKAGGSGGSSSQRQLLEEALEKQKQLLEDFAKIAERLSDVMGRLEGTTFVKRLKAASRGQLQVGEDLASVVAKAFGRPSAAKEDEITSRAVSAASRGNTEVSQKISTIMDDMDAYAERRPLPALRTVLDEMKELDVLGSLRQLGDDMQREAGMSIARTEFWSDTLDRWADELVPPPEDGGGGGGGGGSSAESLPPEVVLETMLILEAETNLREQTRVAEQVRGTLDAEAFRGRAAALAEEQQALGDRVEGILEMLENASIGPLRFADEIERMKQELLPRPEPPPRYAREKQFFRFVRSVMAEAGDILRRPDTGRRAIAAETEVIELLLASQFGGAGGGGGGGGGGAGGGSGSGSALARLGAGVSGRARPEAAEADQAVGRSGVVLPDEFRDGLDAYFNAFERARESLRSKP